MKNQISKYNSVPDVLRDTAQWVLWRSIPRDGKSAKVPFSTSGHPYRPGKTQGLGTFEAAITRFLAGGYDGLGFAFLSSDPFTGIDLDWKHLPSEGLPPTAQAFVRRFASYAELSPSGRGLHIIVRGQLPDDARRRVEINGVHVEVYDRNRYFTVTGNRLPEAPNTIGDAQETLDRMYEKLLRRPPPASLPLRPQAVPVPMDDNELLKRAFAASNGPRIRALYEGDTRSYPSASEADAALAAFLAFYTGPDADRLERLMWNSKLARPDKWKSARGGKTWIRQTVEFAIKSQRRFWRRIA